MTLDPAQTPVADSLVAASPISLADLRALQVPIHWAEAVAVVHHLCQLLADGRVAAGIPALADVSITSAGTVMIRRGATGSRAIDELGRILHELLDAEESPIALRLFVAHSRVSEKYTSVSAFLDALSYYARPNREELIRALYNRCLEAPSATQAPPPEMPGTTPPAPSRVRRRPAVGAVALAAAALTLVVAAAVVWIWRDAPRVSASLAQVRGAVTAAAAAVKQIASGESGNEPVAEATADGPKVVRRSSSPSASRPAGLDVDATALFLAPGPETDQARSPGGIAVAHAGDRDSALVPAPTVGRADADAIYSSAVEGVQPPVMQHPKLPPFVPVDPRVGGTNTMELLVDESGEVRHVQLVTTPERMSDMLLLSTAKTWKFHPALKDGRPVKYRLSLSWVVTPR